MPNQPKRYGVNIRDAIAPKIKELSDSERRNFSQQVHLLLEEALLQRDTKPGIKQVLIMLKRLDLQELSEVLDSIAKLLRQRLAQVNTPFTRMLKQHESQILDAWRQFPGGEIQFNELLMGKKPTDYDLGLLQAGSSLTYEQIVEAYNSTFHKEGNGNGDS